MTDVSTEGCPKLGWTVQFNKDGTCTVSGLTLFQLERSIDACWDWDTVEFDDGREYDL